LSRQVLVTTMGNPTSWDWWTIEQYLVFHSDYWKLFRLCEGYSQAYLMPILVVVFKTQACPSTDSQASDKLAPKLASTS
jgi:hypothetical protein